MATPIDLSTATSAEGQALQLAYAMNALENSNVDSSGAAITNNIQITPNPETGIVTVNFSLPVTTSAAANGESSVADAFLVD